MDKEYDYSKLGYSGKDVFISRNVEIRRPQLVTIENHVAIDSFFYCTTKLKIGKYSHIGPHISIIGGEKSLLVLVNFNSIGAGTRVICASNEFKGNGLIGYGIPEKYLDQVRCKPVVFEDFVNVGSNCVIFPGVILREGSVIGSGAVVTKSTNPWTIYFGIPAKAVGKRSGKIMKEYAKMLEK